MPLPLNPIEFTAPGQSHNHACRVIAIVWTGTTTAADTCLITKNNPPDNDTVWRAQTDTTNTYLGLAPTKYGIHCPAGFTVDTMTAGTHVLVYLAEE